MQKLIQCLVMPEAEYHQIDAVSSTLIKAFNISPSHYLIQKHIGKTMPEFDIGTALHMSILQPDEFDSKIVRGPNNRRGNQWQKFIEEHEEQIVLIADDYELVLRMRDCILTHPRAKLVLESGYAEKTYLWEELDNLPCKCRIDFMRDDGILVDIKTAGENQAYQERTGEAYIRRCWNYGYHIQAAWYLRAINHFTGNRYHTFLHIVVEKNRELIDAGFNPVVVYKMPQYLIDKGDEICDQVLQEIIEFREKMINYFGYSEEIIEHPEIPNWILKERKNYV